ncbi:hypothetical protein [Roseivirga sp. 4D4]|uniref:hypothetical protein n=1 Tax=Roseivirga sp. 4D4 TaxID=1889784 RepID=UPI001112F795|nr:hypothetical protein [Roseivirga sp. 4D4]
MKQSVNRLLKMCLVLLIFQGIAIAQEKESPLEPLAFYIGEWGPPSNDDFLKANPQYKDLRVISFKWGQNKKVIWSTTGIATPGAEKTNSEGIITFNPLNEKLVWLEYQHENEILFEGEYTVLADGNIQRTYAVYYPEGYTQIPYPELEGWVRNFRETFVRVSDDLIDWKTEALVRGKWQMHGPKGKKFQAERKK